MRRRTPLRLWLLLLLLLVPSQAAANQLRVLFGPETFTRTTGAPNVFDRTFTVPAYVGAPFTLHIQNGQPDGSQRLFFGTVSVNGTEVVHPTDFSQYSTIDRAVSLADSNTVRITLSSPPGAVITVTISGTIALGDLGHARAAHTATVLPDGGVLIAGGRDSSSPLSSLERFDAGSLSFGPVSASLIASRSEHTASALANRVHMLVAGQGAGGVLPSTELFDPVTGVLSGVASGINVPRAGHTATVLLDGRVLIVGGQGGTTLANAETFDPQATLLFTPSFDPSSGTFTVVPSALATPRRDHTATLLADGRVLITGGRNGTSYLASAEIFDPATQTFTPLTAALTVARAGHTATLLPDGRVLLLGGQNGSGVLSSAEAYTPGTATFAALSRNLGTERVNHTATLLRLGEVLVAGGENAAGVLATAELYGPPAADTTAPAVAQVNIPNNATGVDLAEILGVRFTEPVDVTTLTTSSVTLTQGGQPVDAVVSPSEQGLLVFLVPADKLEPGTAYTLALSSAIKDTAGNPLPAFSSQFTTVAAPTITAISPTHGLVGATVTITGENFDPAAPALNVVKFDDVEATVTAATATSLTITVPSGVAVGAVATVTVTTRGGSASVGFTVDNPTPVLESLAPTSIVAGSAAFTLTLNGSGFVASSRVNFGALVLTPETSSAAQLTVQVPASAVATVRDVDVTVTNATPGGGTSAAKTFTVFLPAPTIATVSPTHGPGGTPVTLTGQNFDPVAANNTVRFNGVSAVVSAATAITIHASVPVAAPAAVGTVTVTTVGGTVSAPFTVDNPAVTLTSMTPESIRAGSAAFTLTLTGVGFAPTATVGFGATTLTPSSVNATQIVVTVPATAVATPGTAQVRVTNPPPGGGTSNALTFTIINATPTITGFTPTSGVAGTRVTVTGTNFETVPSKNQVTFNGTKAATLSSTTTSLVTVVPIGATTGPIGLTTTGGSATSATNFTVLLSQDFALALAPDSTSVVAGDQISFALSASGSNGFSGIVALAITGLPSGITGTVAAPPGGINAPLPQPTITAGGLVYVTLGVAPTVTAGTYPFSVVGTTTIDGQTVVRNVAGAAQVAAATDTSITGRVLTVLDQPLKGVTVSMDNRTTRTDAAGNFVLTGVQPGSQRTFLIDGHTAEDVTDEYPDVTQLIDVAPNRANRLPFITYLPALSKVKTTLDPTRDTIHTDPAIPNLQVIVPAGTTITKNGQPVTQISVTNVPIERAPMPLPPDFNANALFAVQPGGARASQPVPIIYPNTLGAPPGTRMNLFFANHDTGVWEIYGQGTVSQDGLRIIPDPGVGEVQLAWGGGISPQPPPAAPLTAVERLADPVVASTGQLILEDNDMVLRGRVPIVITRQYVSPETGFFRNVGMSNRFGARTRLKDYDDVIVASGQTLLRQSDFGQTVFSQGPDGVFRNGNAPEQMGMLGALQPDGGAQLRLKDGTVLSFNPAGNLVKRTDRNGNAVTVVRCCADDRIVAVVNPAGQAIGFVYDEFNRIARITDPVGRSVRYSYDAQGRLETVTDAADGVTRYGYPTADAVGRIMTVTDPNGVITATNVYDANGRIVSQRAADNGITTFDYATNGTVVMETTVTDPLFRTTTYRLNGLGLETARVDALGGVTRLFRNFGTNLVDFIVDPANRVTRFTYDGVGNVTSIIDPAGHSTLFEYDPAYGQPTRVTNALTDSTVLRYDSRGNLTRITDPLSHSIEIAYGESGLPLSSRDELGNVTAFEYDAAGNLRKLVEPLGQTTHLDYDSVSRLIRQTDSVGGTTTLEYTALDDVATVTDPAGGVARLRFDANRNLLEVTDPRGGVPSTFGYDAMNRVIRRTDPLLHEEAFDYDTGGNLVTIRDRKGQLTTLGYDMLGHLTSAEYADGSRVRIAYGATGQPVEITDSIGGRVVNVYDVLNRLTAQTTALGTVAYQYDQIGRRSGLAPPSGPATTYGYDAASRLRTISRGPQEVLLEYDASDRRTQLVLPNGVVTEYRYDTASRLVEQTFRAPSATLGNLTYAYDAAGRRLATGGSLARVLLPAPVASALYDAGSRQHTFGEHQSTFDANGNVTSIESGGSAASLTWDARNRLVRIEVPNSVREFTYDALGRRTAVTRDGAPTTFVYDGVEVLQSASAAGTMSYLSGPSIDEPLARGDGEFYLADAIGSVIALTGPDGANTTTYAYEPFGRAGPSGAATDNPFQFTARDNDGDDVYHYRARPYSPVLHRFLSEDPLGVAGSGFNLYQYASNNPLTFSDPLGRNSCVRAAAQEVFTVVVYIALDAATGHVIYAGHTEDFDRRKVDHHRQKGITIQPVAEVTGRTRAEAKIKGRGLEQVCIEAFNLIETGLNKINSISPKNPVYQAATKFGWDLFNKLGLGRFR